MRSAQGKQADRSLILQRTRACSQPFLQDIQIEIVSHLQREAQQIQTLALFQELPVQPLDEADMGGTGNEGNWRMQRLSETWVCIHLMKKSDRQGIDGSTIFGSPT